MPLEKANLYKRKEPSFYKHTQPYIGDTKGTKVILPLKRCIRFVENVNCFFSLLPRAYMHVIY